MILGKIVAGFLTNLIALKDEEEYDNLLSTLFI